MAMNGADFVAWMDISSETLDALIALDTPARIRVCERAKIYDHLPLNDAFKAALATEAQQHTTTENAPCDT